MKVIAGAGEFIASARGQSATWAEHLRVADLSVGTYCIPAGGTDDQSPHTEDEIYIVTAGRARLESGGDVAEVRPGSVIYVPADVMHSGKAGAEADVVFFTVKDASHSLHGVKA